MLEAPVRLDSVVGNGAELLRRAGISDPLRQARRIWADLRGEEPSRVLLWSDGLVDETQRARFDAGIARVAGGEPIPYVTGVAGFRRLTLSCDRRALIPRPETEGLVDLVLERVRGGRVADIGTGSGCIALSLADEGAFDLILGVDRSAQALSLAAANRAKLRLPVALALGDLCQPLVAGAWDAVVSNPPYLTVAEHAGLEAGVRAWEPESALVSGPDGLEHTRRLIVQASGPVRSGGWLALEVDSARSAEVAAMATTAGWHEVSIHHDLFDRARYVVARRSDTA